jgi:hypothetical protein
MMMDAIYYAPRRAGRCHSLSVLYTHASLGLHRLCALPIEPSKSDRVFNSAFSRTQ